MSEVILAEVKKQDVAQEIADLVIAGIHSRPRRQPNVSQIQDHIIRVQGTIAMFLETESDVLSTGDQLRVVWALLDRVSRYMTPLALAENE